MDASSCLALGALNVVAGQQAQAAMAQLLLDHERNGMRAEDSLASSLRYKENMMGEVTDLMSQIQRAEAHLQRGNVEHASMILQGQLLDTSDEEDEDEEDEEMTEQEDSDDDEMGEVDSDMTQSDEPGPALARVSFCEACDRQLPGVVWFLEPFQNPSDNRRLYSACPTCRNRLGLQGAP
jgi:hypothetical protein